MMTTFLRNYTLQLPSLTRVLNAVVVTAHGGSYFPSCVLCRAGNSTDTGNYLGEGPLETNEEVIVLRPPQHVYGTQPTSHRPEQQ